jgi:hypothetical protein
MRAAILVVWLSLVMVGCATTNGITASGPYNVTGHGNTFEQAKESAFRQAVEQSIGSAIISKRVTVDSKLVTKEIASHSSGYVDSFVISSTTQANGKYTVEASVYVKPSMINDYVLHVSEASGKLDGERASATVSTYKKERATGDAYLNKVLQDYPTKAFKIDQGKTEIQADRNRRMILYIPFWYEFNPEYLVGLMGALNEVRDFDCKAMCDKNFGITVNVVKGYEILGTAKTYYFNDSVRPMQVVNTFRESVTFQVELSDITGKVLEYRCLLPVTPSVYDRNPGRLMVNNRWAEQLAFGLDMDDRMQNIMPKVANIKVKAVSNCIY